MVVAREEIGWWEIIRDHVLVCFGKFDLLWPIKSEYPTFPIVGERFLLWVRDKLREIMG